MAKNSSFWDDFFGTSSNKNVPDTIGKYRAKQLNRKAAKANWFGPKATRGRAAREEQRNHWMWS